MVKGQCQKVETLSDGSVKLSIYVNKEDINQAFPLAYKELYLMETLPPETESEQFNEGKKEGIRIAQETIREWLEKGLGDG